MANNKQDNSNKTPKTEQINRQRGTTKQPARKKRSPGEIQINKEVKNKQTKQLRKINKIWVINRSNKLNRGIDDTLQTL